MNEEYIKLKYYIKYNHYYGHSMAKIKEKLLEAGWDKETINKAMNESQKENFIPNPKKKIKA